jgi:hypothetical protein
MHTDRTFSPMYAADVAKDALRRGDYVAVLFDPEEAKWEGCQFATKSAADRFRALTYCPGLVGKLVDLVCDVSRRPNRAAALGTALTVIGTAAGRFVIGPTKSGTHLYILILMPVGAGKDAIMTTALELLAMAGLTHLGGPESMSETATLNFMARQPLSLCTWDEFGMILKKINAKNAGMHEKNILKALNTAWGRSFKLMKKNERAGEKTEDIWWPATSIIAATTPETFWGALSNAEFENGFISRLMVMPSGQRAAKTDPKDLASIDPMLRRSIAALHPQVHAGKFPVYKDQNGKEHDDKSCPTYERQLIRAHRTCICLVRNRSRDGPAIWSSGTTRSRMAAVPTAAACPASCSTSRCTLPLRRFTRCGGNQSWSRCLSILSSRSSPPSCAASASKCTRSRCPSRRSCPVSTFANGAVLVDEPRLLYPGDITASPSIRIC